MTALDFPTAPAPLFATINPYEFGVTQTGFAGGEDREISRLGRRHSIDFTFGQVDGDCAGRFIGLRNKAKVLGATVRLAVPQPPGIGCTLTGVTVRGASQTGRLLNVGGLPTNTGRTNSVLQSETLDNAAWTKVATTISANAAADGAGAATLDKLVESATTADHYLLQAFGFVASSVYATVSFEARAAGRRYIGANLSQGGGNFAVFGFDLTGLTTSSTTVAGTTINATSTITDLGGGLVRCTMTAQFIGSITTLTAQVYLRTTAGVGNQSYLGDGTSGVALGRFMGEIATAATAYVGPTTSAAVTAYSTLAKAGAALSIITASCSYLYTLTDDVIGSASADGQFALDDLLRVSPGNAVAIELLNPIVEGFLQGAQAWSVDRFAAATVSTVTIREAR